MPAFERLFITPKESPSGPVYTLHLVMRGAGQVPASYVSDGTLLALALLTAAHTRTLPDLLLLDDIDHGLHLSAQYTLVTAIRKVMAVRPALQVVCTTHSPYLLDAVAPEEVRVMAVDEDGRTGVRPLITFPEYERYKPGLQTGELWAGIGESWVIKRQAAEHAGD